MVTTFIQIFGNSAATSPAVKRGMMPDWLGSQQVGHGRSEGHLQKPEQTGFYTRFEDCRKDRRVFQVAPKHACNDKGAVPLPIGLQETSRQVK